MIIGFYGFLFLIGLAGLIADRWDKPKKQQQKKKKKPVDTYDDEVRGIVNRAKVEHFILNYQPAPKKVVTEEKNGRTVGYIK